LKNEFQLLERTLQPTLPGPLPADFATWGRGGEAAVPADELVRTPGIEGSKSSLQQRRRLKVVEG
jgi:anaerobic magnesium-protoporphyrin IX monomethyl ester cyclase